MFTSPSVQHAPQYGDDDDDQYGAVHECNTVDTVGEMMMWCPTVWGNTNVVHQQGGVQYSGAVPSTAQQ